MHGYRNGFSLTFDEQGVHIIDMENVRRQFIQLVERKKIWVERLISTRTQIWINFLLTLVMFYIFLQTMHSINKPFLLLSFQTD